MSRLSVVILGLSITSSWGNGHATTFRGLVRALDRRGHQVLFLERNVPWYAENRDLPSPPWGRTALYDSLDELRQHYAEPVRHADLVILGSYVPEGVEVGRWLLETALGKVAFYDIDTPVTLARLAAGDREYLAPELIPGFDLYLSFTGGPVLGLLEERYGARRARPFYCSADPDIYRPQKLSAVWDLGYLGTYSPDRQPAVDRLLVTPATQWPEGRFVAAGPQFPPSVVWPPNVTRIEHLPPPRHCRFYNSQRFTLNVTRADMVRAGWSPSVRLFEAAACGVPVISDYWEGLESLFEPEREIFIASGGEEVLHLLRNVGERKRKNVGRRARERVLAEHTAEHRVHQLETYLAETGTAPGTGERQCLSPGAGEASRAESVHSINWPG